MQTMGTELMKCSYIATKQKCINVKFYTYQCSYAASYNMYSGVTIYKQYIVYYNILKMNRGEVDRVRERESQSACAV